MAPSARWDRAGKRRGAARAADWCTPDYSPVRGVGIAGEQESARSGQRPCWACDDAVDGSEHRAPCGCDRDAKDFCQCLVMGVGVRAYQDVAHVKGDYSSH